MKCRNSIWQNLAAINIKNSHQLRDRRKLHPSDRMPLRTAYYSALKFCFPLSSVQFSSVQLLTCVWLFATPWTAALQASLTIATSWSLLKLESIESVMPSNHLILRRALLLPSIFPSIRVFPNESALHIRWPKYWSFSVSISPSNEYSGLIPFRMVGSSCSPRDSQESSPTPQFKNTNSLVLSFLYSPILTSIQDYRKNHSFD